MRRIAFWLAYSIIGLVLQIIWTLEGTRSLFPRLVNLFLIAFWAALVGLFIGVLVLYHTPAREIDLLIEEIEQQC